MAPHRPPAASAPVLVILRPRLGVHIRRVHRMKGGIGAARVRLRVEEGLRSARGHTMMQAAPEGGAACTSITAHLATCKPRFQIPFSEFSFCIIFGSISERSRREISRSHSLI